MKSSIRTISGLPTIRSIAAMLLTPVALLTIVAASFAVAPASASAQSTPRAAATAPCKASVTSGTGVVFSSFIIGVSAGTTKITLDCNLSVNPGIAVEASLLSGVPTMGVSLTGGVDTGALGTFAPSATDTGCPAGTAGSCTLSVFTVPASFTATDSNAVCAPSQAQVNAGLFGCALVVATAAQAQIPGAEYLMTYAGEPTPLAPTITPTVTTGPAGSTITVSDAAASPAHWWGNGLASSQATVLGAAAPIAPSTCGTGGGYGNVPSPFLAVNFFAGGKAPAIPASASGLSISNNCYDGKTLYAPALSGTITAPASLTTGTTYTAYVCELNLTPITSNDPAAATNCGPLPAGESWVDASFNFTAATGTPQSALSVTSTTGTQGTPLTLVTSGGSGTGAVTFAALDGTATGCSVTSGALSATTGGTCVVTATKAADTTYLAASSTPITVALAPLPAPKIITNHATLAGTAKTLAISVTCGPAACSGSLSASVKVKLPVKGKLKLETLKLGSKRFSLAANVTKSVSISLSAAARSYLKANPKHPTLSATVSITGVKGVSSVTKRVSLLK
jgi:hypothetical protein